MVFASALFFYYLKKCKRLMRILSKLPYSSGRAPACGLIDL